ncbi:MAG: DUF3021 domain-containing protein [Peptococcaceae bacterium]|nr:DUF3021 domain-containing protein [Peptococcaceae bacterium]
MKPLDAVKFMFILFCVITTGQVLFMALIPLFSEDFIFTAQDLYKIPLVAVLGTLPVILLIHKDTAPKTEIILRNALHFILTATLVLGSLIYLGWLDAESAVGITVFFLALYIGVWVVNIKQARKLADKLNERINAIHSETGAPCETTAHRETAAPWETATHKGENATHRDKP